MNELSLAKLLIRIAHVRSWAVEGDSRKPFLIDVRPSQHKPLNIPKAIRNV
jgi:hypothetical protein